MKVKNWLLAIVLMIMPIIAYCHELDDAYDCKFEWSASSNSSKITFPSDKDCYQTSVSNDYLTENSFISLTRGAYKYRSYSSVGNCGDKIEEILYFTVKSNSGTYGPYKWNEKITDFDYKPPYNFDNDYVGSQSSKSLTIAYSTLDKIFLQGAQKHLNTLGEKVTVTFQVLTNVKIYRGSCHEKENKRKEYDRSFTVKGKPVSIQLLHCASGEIGANSAFTPEIENGDGTGKYCIYPTPVRSASDAVMQITNVQSPGKYEMDLYFSWNLKYKYRPIPLKTERRKVYIPDESANEQNLGKFVTFSYSDLGEYNVGDQYAVTRTISLTNTYWNEMGCATPELTFEIVPEAFLSEKGNNSEKICPEKTEMDFSGTTEYQDPRWQ